MYKSNFGIKGCLSNPDMDNGKSSGGCSIEKRIDSMGNVKMGGCGNSQTGGAGYVNSGGWPPCCINDPPQNCISSQDNSSQGSSSQRNNNIVTNCKAGTYANKIDEQMCQYEAALQKSYLPPPTIFNTPYLAQPAAYNVSKSASGSSGSSQDETTRQSTYSPPSQQQQDLSQQIISQKTYPIQPVAPKREKRWYDWLFGNSSSFGVNSISKPILLIIVLLICLIVFYFIKKKKSAFGKRKRR